MLIVDHLTHIYEKNTAMAQTAIHDINLVIPEGQFIGLIGHTGSGKSTLIQHLNGLLKPTSGSVFFHGADIHDDDFDRKQLRSKVGLVFQYPEHQLFEVDVWSDVCFGPRNLGLDKLNVELRAYHALKQVGISDEHFYQSPFDLSGGEKRRVAIAGVLAMAPEVLILDEPTAGLDPGGRDEILGQIAALQAETGITVVLVSHSMDDIAKHVERIIVMRGGKIADDDVPTAIFMKFAELEEMGLGAPQMTYIMDALRLRGLAVDPAALTVTAAYNSIMKALGMENHHA
ncbi:MAG: energy-coupling factor transporter ATPase [Lachnospiraceae bacterium]|nr:energy-coupling factor transporter ATPase [Lachnospiraceae bacterium]